MAATNKVLVDGVVLTNAISLLYTVASNVATTRIVAFTVTNDDVAAVITYDLHIVPSGDSADASNRLVKEAVLSPKESDQPSAILNQLVPTGGSIQALASTTLKISVRASGIEFT